MNSAQKVTAWVAFSTMVFLLAYDVFAYLHGGVGATLSWVIFDQSKSYSIIPFFFGLLMGHFFGQMRNPDKANGPVR